MRSPVFLLALLTLIVGCSSGNGAPATNGSGDPASLVGVANLEMFEPVEGVDRPGVSVVDDSVVEIVYFGGPVCRPDWQNQEPGAIEVVYTTDQIEIRLEPATRNCEGDTIAFAAGARITLEEPVAERSVVLAS